MTFTSVSLVWRENGGEIILNLKMEEKKIVFFFPLEISFTESRVFQTFSSFFIWPGLRCTWIKYSSESKGFSSIWGREGGGGGGRHESVHNHASQLPKNKTENNEVILLRSKKKMANASLVIPRGKSISERHRRRSILTLIIPWNEWQGAE